MKSREGSPVWRSDEATPRASYSFPPHWTFHLDKSACPFHIVSPSRGAIRQIGRGGMRLVLAAIIATIASSSVQSKAPATSFAAKVQSSVRSLEDGSDKAFVKTWAEYSDAVSAAGATATQVRAATRWITAAYSLGICEAPDRDIAAWYSKFDALTFGSGAASPALREMLRKTGSDSLSEGQNGSELDELTPREKAGLCAVELEAVRRVLASIND